jgi:PiT family inorganic phosphate transporter
MGLALLVVAVVFVAFANGANDNFKGVATLHGSGTLAYRPALAWATATTLAGSLAAAWLSGGLVRRFTGKGLVDDAIVGDPVFLLAVAIGAAGTVLLATRLGFPISTTHALTGALVGAGIVVAGPSHIAYGTLGRSFALPLLASPLLATALTATLYAALRQTRLGLGVTHEDCICVGLQAPLAALTAEGRVVSVAGGPAMSVDRPERCARRYTGTVLGLRTQSVLNAMHVLTAGAVGFARGLNDTPKILALLVGARALGVHDGIGLVALAMAVGGILASRRVAHTMAYGITGMNHGQGFTANLVTATLVAVASPLGLPVSTTHVSCGTLFGIGAVNGEARWRVIGQVFMAWVTTLPVAIILAATLAILVRAVR